MILQSEDWKQPQGFISLSNSGSLDSHLSPPTCTNYAKPAPSICFKGICAPVLSDDANVLSEGWRGEREITPAVHCQPQGYKLQKVGWPGNLPSLLTRDNPCSPGGQQPSPPPSTPSHGWNIKEQALGRSYPLWSPSGLFSGKMEGHIRVNHMT